MFNFSLQRSDTTPPQGVWGDTHRKITLSVTFNVTVVFPNLSLYNTTRNVRINVTQGRVRVTIVAVD